MQLVLRELEFVCVSGADADARPARGGFPRELQSEPAPATRDHHVLSGQSVRSTATQ